MVLSALLSGILIAACSTSPEPAAVEPEGTAESLSQARQPTVEPSKPQGRRSQARESTVEPEQPELLRPQVLEITVGPARKECYGPFRRMCLIVDGSFFYDEIDGFTHEPGYEYRLRIERYDAFPGQAEPPQDAGRYGYRLLAVISRTEASGNVVEAAVAPVRINCPKSDRTCLLLDGKPFRGAMSGFDFQAGYNYRIRYELFADGSSRLLEVLSRTPADSAVEEITVGPWRAQCYENAPITAACIVVNDEPYYGHIEDFPRSHGYEYRLRVERYDLMPGVEVPPEETPKYGYRLLKILSEDPASQPPPAN